MAKRVYDTKKPLTIADKKFPALLYVVDHVSTVLHIPPREAAEVVKERLLDSQLKSWGPDGPIPREFWRFAAIHPYSGRVTNVKTKKQLEWVEVAAEQALRIWPIVAPRIPRSAEPEVIEAWIRKEAEQAIAAGAALDRDETVARARATLGGSVNQIRSIFAKIVPEKAKKRTGRPRYRAPQTPAT